MSKRRNAGYEIIVAIPLNETTELVIGRNEKRLARYVVWYCMSGDSYHNGGYCSTYRKALEVVMTRIRENYQYISGDMERSVEDED